MFIFISPGNNSFDCKSVGSTKSDTSNKSGSYTKSDVGSVQGSYTKELEEKLVLLKNKEAELEDKFSNLKVCSYSLY